jgi:hypothetical protein
LVFIGVHCDDWDKGLEAAKEDGIEYIVANDDGEKSQTAYNLEYYPTIFVIDKEGAVRYQDPDNLEETIKELLAE